MHRFFVEKEQIEDNNIKILGTDVKHIKDVIRLKEGDIVEIVAERKVYICQIESLSKKQIDFKVLDQYLGQNEANTEIVLYQGLAKASKMDFIIQKCTELGVNKIYPLSSHRSVVKIKDAKKEESKVNRWNQIADEASKQSKRDALPKVENIIDFNEMIQLLKDEENIIVAYEDEKGRSIGQAIKDIGKDKFHLIIGPEGGFEEYEIEKLRQIGANIVTLGPRILRTETAGIVAATIILYAGGDLGVI